MAVSILDPSSSLETILDENSFSVAALLANPLVAALAQDFIAFQTDWMTVNAMEIQHRIEIVKASALVSAADDGLDIFVSALAKTILIAVKNERSDPLYQLYFGKQRPSDIQRPVLGPELETVREWVPSLKASANPALAALGVELEQLVANADAAVAALKAAEQKAREFRTIGERKALFDKANALRKNTWGKLSGMPHEQPELRLPTSFADQFFRHHAGSKKASGPTTIAELIAVIDTNEAELTALKAKLAAAQAESEAAAAVNSQLEAEQAALEAAKQLVAASAAKVAALKAKAGG